MIITSCLSIIKIRIYCFRTFNAGDLNITLGKISQKLADSTTDIDDRFRMELMDDLVAYRLGTPGNMFPFLEKSSFHWFILDLLLT